MRRLHFIAGYPRAGTTLLSALFRQNPTFHAGIISPVAALCGALQREFSPNVETHGFFTETKRRALFRGVVNLYYQDVHKNVVFDTNRRWPLLAELLSIVFPESKIICCVRPIREVLNSFERVFRANIQASTVFGCDPSLNVYQRCDRLLAPDGVVGYARQAVAQALAGPARANVIVVEYRDLITATHATMQHLHSMLGEPLFTYDLNKIKQIPGAAEFDQSLGAPGLHHVRKTVSAEPVLNYLPSDIIIKEDATTAG